MRTGVSGINNYYKITELAATRYCGAASSKEFMLSGTLPPATSAFMPWRAQMTQQELLSVQPHPQNETSSGDRASAGAVREASIDNAC